MATIISKGYRIGRGGENRQGSELYEGDIVLFLDKKKMLYAVM
jgi:hypothetical protein